MVWAPDRRPLHLVPTAPESPPHASPGAPGDASSPLSQLGGYAQLTEWQLLRQLGSSARGLTEQEADARLARLGENLLPVSGMTVRSRLAATLKDPFTLVLAALSAASVIIGSLGAATVIAVLATLGCVLRFLAERHADRSAAARAALDAATATVLRRAEPGTQPLARDLPLGQVVPGDVVLLAPGDPVPADLRLLRADGLRVSQAALTGESAPVDKTSGRDACDRGDGTANPFGHSRLCFLGSTVTAGTGTGVVLATGPDSYYGSTHIEPPRRGTPTAFTRGSAGIARSLALFTALAAATALVVNSVRLGVGVQAAEFAVAVAVGLTPEMLPVVVSSVLARGSVLLARRGIVVKRLPAVHDLGAMDVLCTDKTGTLTRGRPAVSCHLGPDGAPDSGVLHWAAVNSLLSLEQGELLTGDPVDEAVLDAAHPLGLPVDAAALSAVATLPFTPARRRSTVVLRRPGHPDGHTLVTKGAPEEVLARCRWTRSGGGTTPLDAAGRSRLRDLVDRHAEEGTSLLAVARAHRPARLGAYGTGDEADLTLLGFVGVRDELLPGASAALAGLADAGVDVRIVTGDHPKVAWRICRDAGLDPDRSADSAPDPSPGPAVDPATGPGRSPGDEPGHGGAWPGGPGGATGAVVLGPDTDALDDYQLTALASRTRIFARMTPRQKARVVEALRRGGHVVGYLGDGVNDLAALAAADVGISPEGGVQAARTVADTVLLRKDLAALGEAVATGRRSVGAVVTYLRITFSSNFGNTLSMILGSVLLPFLPMLPAQILVQNLCFDAAQLALAFDRPHKAQQDQQAQRTRWRPHHSRSQDRAFGRRRALAYMVCFGVLNSLSDLATFAILGHLTGHHHDAAAQAAFRSGWLTENLITQALALHLLRRGSEAGARSGSRSGVPLRERVAAWPVWLAAAALATAALALPRSPFAAPLGLGPLPLSWLPYLAVVVAGYCSMVVAAKRLWRRYAS